MYITTRESCIRFAQDGFGIEFTEQNGFGYCFNDYLGDYDYPCYISDKDACIKWFNALNNVGKLTIHQPFREVCVTHCLLYL